MPFGNDEDVLIDPGYKEPVISFEYQDKSFVDTNEYENQLPLGVWIRNETLCYKTLLVSKANRRKSVLSVLNEDIKLNIAGADIYSGNKLNKSLTRLIKEDDMNIFKLNCSIYATGMILSNEWRLKGSILTSLNKLNVHIKGDNKVANDEGVRNSWYQLFNTYGTHVMTKITLGGKIIEINNNKKNLNDKDTKNEDNKNLKLVIFKFNTNVKNNDHKQDINKNKYEKIIIIGGNVVSNNLDDQSDGLNKEKWIKSIKYNPVPIQFELTPLSYFIHQNFDNDNLLISYEYYLNQYLK